MARTLEVSSPAKETDRVTGGLALLDGVVGVSVQKAASIKPAGDVIIVHATNDAVPSVLGLVARELGSSCSVISSEPRSIVCADGQNGIDREGDEASWPEIATELRRDTNPGPNFFLAMFFAAIIATVGIWTTTIHVVIGAMVIAPGFEPITRVPFGILARDRNSWQQGLVAIGAGYLTIVIGGAAGALVLAQVQPLTTSLGQLRWVEYWSTFSASSIITAFAAGVAGAAIIAAHRSVLTAGVMIALALIPTATLTGMALVNAEFDVAARAAGRWAIDAGLVALASALVFGIKRARMPERERLARVQAPTADR